MKETFPHISRLGAYGAILRDNKILLTKKKSGPYVGRWGLPGGGIEFGETPEKALEREIEEETGYAAKQFTLVQIATFLGNYEKGETLYQFYHIGIIYEVGFIEFRQHLLPEEETRWAAFDELKFIELTPFAQQFLERSKILISNEALHSEK